MGVDYGGRPSISVRFNELGRKQFARFTTKNINKAIAIVVDGLVYSAPFVNESIEGGNVEIAGVFTKAEAKQFADMLSAGYLPVRLTLIR
jgi:preprotein translocase subunit SecD